MLFFECWRRPIKTSGVTPTRSQRDRKNYICASSLHHPCPLGHAGTPGAQLAKGTKPPCSPSPRHRCSQVLLRKTMSGFQHQSPLPGSTDYLLPSLHGGPDRGPGGRKLLDQAQVRLSHTPAGKLGGSWRAYGHLSFSFKRVMPSTFGYWTY